MFSRAEFIYPPTEMIRLFLIAVVCSTGNILGLVLQSRIVNGTDARSGEFPYMASVKSRQNVHLCGSTLISDKWVLTAAHCVLYRMPSGLNIVYGATNLQSDSHNTIPVSEIHIHEEYEQKYFENDIALLKTSGTIKLGQNAQTVRLATRQLSSGTQVTLIGWGQKKWGGPLQSQLQKVDLFTLSNEQCSAIHFQPIFNSNICAGVEGGGKGQCVGDSGGPLLIDGYQYGVVSWSVKPCGFPPYPGVFTKILSYVDWIKAKTGMFL